MSGTNHHIITVQLLKKYLFNKWLTKGSAFVTFPLINSPISNFMHQAKERGEASKISALIVVFVC